MRSLIFILSLLVSAQSLAAGRNSAPTDMLKDNQRDYYLQIFEYAMESTEKDGVYNWKSEVGNGKIRVGTAYRSKSGVVCRNFTETFTIGKKSGNSGGAGCKRDGYNNGWCRVKDGDAHTCSLEHPQTSVGKALDYMDSDLSGAANEFFR